jgi:hypothetical protein
MKFTTAVTILATAVISAVSAQDGVYTTFKDCSTGSPTDFTATSVSISPSPLCISKPFCLTASGTLTAPITQGASYVITGRWLGRVVYTETHDLCTLLAANGQNCDVPAGPFTLNLCVDVKANYPAGVSTSLRHARTVQNLCSHLGGLSSHTPMYLFGSFI